MIVSASSASRSGSNRQSLRHQRLARPVARDGNVDAFTGERAGEGLSYRTETYNRITHITSPILIDVDSRPSTVLAHARASRSHCGRRTGYQRLTNR
jgi:hypothetical protein